MIRPDKFDVGAHGRTKFARFGLGDVFIGTFPQGKQQGTDALPLLHIIDVIIGIEGIEGNGMLISVGKIDPVLALGLAVDKLAQALIAVTRIDQEHVCPLLVILAYHVIGEERLATARRTEDKLVAVGNDTFLHRQVGDVQMDGLARKSVNHLDAEGRERVLIVGLSRKEAKSRLNKGIKTLLTWKICGIAGNTCPIEGCHINGVVAWLALH